MRAASAGPVGSTTGQRRANGGPLPSRSGSLQRYREDDAPAGTWNLFITPTIALGRQPRHPIGSVSE